MTLPADPHTILARRTFLHAGLGLGGIALASLQSRASAAPDQSPGPHFRPRARRVIFLCQSGAPSQLELFDPKPELKRRHGEELPESIRKGQRLTTMTSNQESRPLTAPRVSFARHGQSGAELSELLPHTASIADELCFVRSMRTDAINHDPGITFLQTGSQQPGRPSFGSWVSYGLGSENEDLPSFVVFISGGVPGDQPLFGRLWGSGFLPPSHQGVKFHGGREPVLFLANPPGISRSIRGRMLQALRRLNRREAVRVGDPRISAATGPYEMAFRMQAAAPELADLSDEPERTFQLYGPQSRQPGTYAANCLLARRLVERGVRFVQLYHRGWDHHLHLPGRIRGKCKQTDQPSAALIRDLKQRGLLEDTLVIWAGEFGRTAYCQGKLTADDYGRDHHPRCFTIWMAGGGIRRGLTYGQTDDFSYNVTQSPVSIHDLQATVLHCLGLNHLRLTYRSQGRDFRLTDVGGEVVRPLLA